ncbi:hypothetical protein JQ543_13715 [Bradyrhizobium diazoefficiens]|nr:hypothetical protein [Bradyrhizobium diazoefficiens]MBR0848805.1 hypothetical protein [Bradyrhizobium diazoefficiens]
MKQSWPYFLFLILVATLIAYRLHYVILVVAAIVLLVRGWVSLAFRYPLTTLFITAFIRGLLGRRW